MKRLILTLIFVLACAAQLGAAVTFDAATGAYCATDGSCSAATTFPLPTATTLTYAHTTGVGSNRAIAVFVLIGCSGTDVSPSISSVTYAGVSLSNTSLPNVTAGSGPPRRGMVWSLPAGTQPTSGANNVVITLSGSLITACPVNNPRVMSGTVTASGVDQTTTFTGSGGSSGSGTTASTTLTSGANDLVAHSGCSGDNTSAPTGTSRWANNDTQTSCNSNVGATAAGGTTAPQFTVASSDSWIELAVSFKEAGGGGGDTPTTQRIATTGVGR